MIVVSLARFPSGYELEDLVAALTQGTGAYVAKQVRDHVKGAEVQELDVIATHYENAGPANTLVEVKSGSWGIGDVFKAKGRMCYLGATTGALISNRSPERLELARVVGARLGVSVNHFADLSNPTAVREVIGAAFGRPVPAPVGHRDFVILQFGNRLERALYWRMTQLRKSVSSLKAHQAIWEYFNLVNGDIHFMPNVLERVNALYNAFAAFPNNH